MSAIDLETKPMGGGVSAQVPVDYAGNVASFSEMVNQGNAGSQPTEVADSKPVPQKDKAIKAIEDTANSLAEAGGHRMKHFLRLVSVKNNFKTEEIRLPEDHDKYVQFVKDMQEKGKATLYDVNDKQVEIKADVTDVNMMFQSLKRVSVEQAIEGQKASEEMLKKITEGVAVRLKGYNEETKMSGIEGMVALANLGDAGIDATRIDFAKISDKDLLRISEELIKNREAKIKTTDGGEITLKIADADKGLAEIEQKNSELHKKITAELQAKNFEEAIPNEEKRNRAAQAFGKSVEENGKPNVWDKIIAFIFSLFTGKDSEEIAGDRVQNRVVAGFREKLNDTGLFAQLEEGVTQGIRKKRGLEAEEGAKPTMLAEVKGKPAETQTTIASAATPEATTQQTSAPAAAEASAPTVAQSNKGIQPESVPASAKKPADAVTQAEDAFAKEFAKNYGITDKNDIAAVSKVINRELRKGSAAQSTGDSEINALTSRIAKALEGDSKTNNILEKYQSRSVDIHTKTIFAVVSALEVKSGKEVLAAQKKDARSSSADDTKPSAAPTVAGTSDKQKPVPPTPLPQQPVQEISETETYKIIKGMTASVMGSGATPAAVADATAALTNIAKKNPNLLSNNKKEFAKVAAVELLNPSNMDPAAKRTADRIRYNNPGKDDNTIVNTPFLGLASRIEGQLTNERVSELMIALKKDGVEIAANDKTHSDTDKLFAAMSCGGALDAAKNLRNMNCTPDGGIAAYMPPKPKISGAGDIAMNG